MSTFSLEVIETLDYDFTEIPSNSGSGKCKGRGTIPEPSQPRLEAYSSAVRELFDVKENKDVASAIDRDAAEKEKSSTLRALITELCQNTPSKEQIEDLPPRYQRAFLKWIFGSLTDPKLTSCDTPH